MTDELRRALDRSEGAIRNSGWNIASGTLTLLQAVPIIAILVMGAWWVFSERSSFYAALAESERQNAARYAELSQGLTALSATVDRLAQTLQLSIEQRTRDRYTAQTALIDCLEFQIANPNWRCPKSRSTTLVEPPS